jgi:hypothetical protein
MRYLVAPDFQVPRRSLHLGAGFEVAAPGKLELAKFERATAHDHLF